MLNSNKNISIGIINLKLNNLFSIISCIQEIGTKLKL